MSLVLVRMPTYRRPLLVARAIKCLQSQIHQDWVCEVRDDCPDGSARSIVEDINDARVHYTHNSPQKFMVRNLDDCYLRKNSFGADYFFMLEDDNQVLPGFMSTGIDIIEQMGVSICQMNQVIEYNSGSPTAYVGELGLFDNTFDQRAYTPDELRLAMFGAFGISNGAVFWSKNIKRELAVCVPTLPTLEEYLRAVLLIEPVYICREKLAIWAKNEESTNRNLGLATKYRQRELNLKASLIALQRAIWDRTPSHLRESFLAGGVLRIPIESRRLAWDRAGIRYQGDMTSARAKIAIKRTAIQTLGTIHPSVMHCLNIDSMVI